MNKQEIFFIIIAITAILIAIFALKDKLLPNNSGKHTLNIVEAINIGEKYVIETKEYKADSGKNIKLLATPTLSKKEDKWDIRYVFDAASKYQSGQTFQARAEVTIVKDKVINFKYFGEDAIMNNRYVFEKYIRENIAKVSTISPVLGGTFHVTSVSFKDDYNAIVRYEDGHIAVRAEIQFEISSNKEVKIIKFDAKQQ